MAVSINLLFVINILLILKHVLMCPLCRNKKYSITLFWNFSPIKFTNGVIFFFLFKARVLFVHPIDTDKNKNVTRLPDCWEAQKEHPAKKKRGSGPGTRWQMQSDGKGAKSMATEHAGQHQRTERAHWLTPVRPETVDAALTFESLNTSTCFTVRSSQSESMQKTSCCHHSTNHFYHLDIYRE